MTRVAEELLNKMFIKHSSSGRRADYSAATCLGETSGSGTR
jgi:hypothetical protein